LVLDEVTANLDPVTTAKIWRTVFKRYGDRTIVAISHEPELLRHVGRKVLFKDGVGREV
jgi:ABC-type bacteriocin/lantibiotic exporter with double-glycine peptidase domain